MKLFKKLAAAVLVAALALMMVGCGSKTGLAQQIKDAVSDDAVLRNEQATNSKDLDALAAKLLTEYNNEIAALDEDEDWPDLQELLDDETFLKKVGIDPATEAYALSLTRNPSYLSNTMNQAKPFEIAGDLVYRLMQGDLEIGEPKLGRKFEFGLAIGTLDGENWVLMLMK